MDCEQTRELLEAYALDALDPDERAAVERHLAGCADCRRVAADLARTAATLPHALAAASALTPPPALKQRLMQRLDASLAADETVQAPPHAASDEPLRLSPVRRSLSQGPWRLAARVAAVLVLAFSLTWGVRLTDALERERALRAEYVGLVEQVVGQQELVFEVIGFDDTTRRFLQAQQPGSTSYGKLFTRPSMPYVVAMAGRLPQAPPGAEFHLWLTSGGRTIAAGVLTVDERGFGLLVFTADQLGPSYELAVVTLQLAGRTEPAGMEILRWEAGDGTSS